MLTLLCAAESCNTEPCQAWAKRCPGSSPPLAAEPNPLLLPAIECSGHGVCSRSPVDCRDGDPCVSACICDTINGEEWAGSDCALTSADLDSARARRGELLSIMLTAWNQSYADGDCTAQQVSALSVLATTQPDQLTDSDKLLLLSHTTALASSMGSTRMQTVLELISVTGAVTAQTIDNAAAATQLNVTEDALSSTTAVAHAAVSITRDTIHTIATSVLVDFVMDETPLSFQASELEIVKYVCYA